MKNFVKKPLNLVSLILAVLGVVGILVMLIVPHGKTYTATVKVGNTETYARMELKDGEIYTSTKVDDEWTKGVSMGDFDVEKGNLVHKTSVTSTKLGKINAFRFVPAGTDDVKYTCKLTIVFFVIACVMTVVGGAGIVYGAVSSKKKK